MRYFIVLLSMLFSGSLFAQVEMSIKGATGIKIIINPIIFSFNFKLFSEKFGKTLTST